VHFGGHVDCMTERLLSDRLACDSFPRATSYVFSAEDADMLFKRRGMFFPDALCGFCQRGKGRVVFSFYSFDMNIRSERGLDKQHADKIRVFQVVSSLSALFPNRSCMWSIDCPAFEMSQSGNVHFTAKYMGHAFFICRCSRNPTYLSALWGRAGRGRQFLPRKAVCYHCPDPPEEDAAEDEDESGVSLRECIARAAASEGEGIVADKGLSDRRGADDFGRYEPEAERILIEDSALHPVSAFHGLPFTTNPRF